MKAANDDGAIIEDRDHWLDRAEHHLDLGERSDDSRASWAHFQLAGGYLDRAYGRGEAERDDWESGTIRLTVLQ